MTDLRRGGGARLVLGNWASMVGAELATRALSLAALLYLSRTLAPRDVGMVEFGVAVFAFLFLVSLNGVDVRLVPALVARPDETARLAGRGMVLGWTQLALAGSVLLAIARWAGVPPDMWVAALLFGSAAVLAPPSLGFAFLARERMWPVALGLVANSLVYLGLVVAFVRAPGDAYVVGACFVLATAVRSLIPFAAFVRAEGMPVLEVRDLGRDVLHTAGLGLGGMARGLMGSVDVLVLGLLAPPEAVAAYGLGAKLPLFMASVAAMAHVVLFPTLARAVTAADRGRIAGVERAAVGASLACVLPGVVCLGAVSGPIVTMLFTTGFAAAAPVTAVLLWRVPLLALAGVHRTRLWAESPARDARVAVQVLVASIVLLVGATHAWGSAATAPAMVAADAVAVVLYARHTGGATAARFRPAARGVAAAAVAVLVMLVFPCDGRSGVVVAVAVWAALAIGAAWRPVEQLRRLLDVAG